MKIFNHGAKTLRKMVRFLPTVSLEGDEKTTHGNCTYVYAAYVYAEH